MIIFVKVKKAREMQFNGNLIGLEECEMQCFFYLAAILEPAGKYNIKWNAFGSE
jgi:hypothetical protein